MALGEIPPKGYGVAYHDYERNCHVFYPLGINWIVMLWSNMTFLYWRIAWWTPKGQRRFESRLRHIARGAKSYNRGYYNATREREDWEQQAYERGFRNGLFVRELATQNTAENPPTASPASSH